MDTACDTVKEYNSYTPLHVVQGLQELLFFLYFLMLAHSVITTVLQGILVTVRLTSADPCQAQISKLLCYSLRISSSLPISAFVWTHLGITRVVSTFSARQKLQLMAGRCMILVSIVYPCALAYLSYSTENFEGRVPYCTGATAGSAQTSQYSLLVMFILDVLNLVLDIGLLKYNQHLMKNDKSYHLEVTFRREQNVSAIQQFLPSAIFHCICYLVQVFMMYFGRSFRNRVSDIEYNTINAYTYLMPYYCAIGPIILLILMKKGRLIRKENLKNVVVPMSEEANNIQFSALNAMWGVRESRPVESIPDAPPREAKPQIHHDFTLHP